VVEIIEDSIFTDNQLITILFEHSQLNYFARNTFNGINKAIKLFKNSTGLVQDSIFLNMVQNIRDGSIYQSNIATDGSAIGKLILAYAFRNH